MTTNIPSDLTDRPQWVCFDIVEGKKIPYIPGTGDQAASNRPTDWRSFRAACKDVEAGKRQHVGYCFATHDPFTFIDLDDMNDPEQKTVFDRIDSYAQYSVSGNGVHIICKGSFKGAGKHPNKPSAGIFKEARFCLMTGDIVAGRSTINVVEDHDLQTVHSWLGGGKDAASIELTEYRPTLPDMTVLEMGKERFLKFDELCSGRWSQYTEYNNDHSSADHAFIAMLCDLTASNDQVRWFFFNSGMWDAEREKKKAGASYVDRTIKKIRTHQAVDAQRSAAITFRLGKEEQDVPDEIEVEELEADIPVEVPDRGATDLIDSMPAGLIRDIARYSYKSSYHPLQESSVCGAMMFMSGMCGRAYMTPTKSGLNLWMSLVGGTSCGKDEYQQGIKRILTAVAARTPHIRKIFGGEIVSGPGIEQVFQTTARYISYVPEFGDFFRALANPSSQEHTKTLMRGLLNSYNSAGLGGSTEGRRKAQSGDEKTYIERPCLCLAGESTPEALYGSMTSRELSTGFLQRFMLVDVSDKSWSRGENPKNGAPPPKELIERLAQLARMMDEADPKHGYTVVDAEPDAGEFLRRYRDKKRLAVMRCAEGLAEKEVINRAGLKAIRVATLLAVSSDPYAPIIKMEHAKWAVNFIEMLDNAMLARFDGGEVGGGQIKQETDVLKAFRELSKMSVKKRLALGMTKVTAQDAAACPNAILKKKVTNHPAFANDRLGAVTAFERCVESLIKSGDIAREKPDTAWSHYGVATGSVLLLINHGK